MNYITWYHLITLTLALILTRVLCSLNGLQQSFGIKSDRWLRPMKVYYAYSVLWLKVQCNVWQVFMSLATRWVSVVCCLFNYRLTHTHTHTQPPVIPASFSSSSLSHLCAPALQVRNHKDREWAVPDASTKYFFLLFLFLCLLPLWTLLKMDSTFCARCLLLSFCYSCCLIMRNTHAHIRLLKHKANMKL